MEEIIKAIKRERAYQDEKWGTVKDHPHDVPGWILIMQSELHEATEAWVHCGGDAEALREVLQVVATGIACLEQHGIFERQYIGKGQRRS